VAIVVAGILAQELGHNAVSNTLRNFVGAFALFGLPMLHPAVRHHGPWAFVCFGTLHWDGYSRL
jgi:hypothetical protein